MSVKCFFDRLGRVFDAARILAFILLLLYLPALVLIAFMVLMTSRGPAFVNRVYERANGSSVDLWEFRTECWRLWRTTHVGKYLRRTNTHRLPSLINIVLGQIDFGEKISPSTGFSK